METGHSITSSTAHPTARPDFFIVGAPRCATTAMYEYLRQHPQVFMPRHKEPLFFGADLSHLHGPLTMHDYLRLFRSARAGQRVGEASTWYLYSKTAAGEIHSFAPNAQIIIMLRDPVEVMYSLHQELVFYQGETIRDFEEALAAEGDRKAGRRHGPGRRPETRFYREVVRFAEQVERFLATFGRDRIKIVLYDDFVADAPSVYADVCRFLAIDPGFRPGFGRVNASKLARSARLQALIVRPPSLLARAVLRTRRYGFAHLARALILALNSRAAERPTMTAELRGRLVAELSPEVERLEEVIRRPLPGWKRPPGAPSAQFDPV